MENLKFKSKSHDYLQEYIKTKVHMRNETGTYTNGM